MTTKKQVRMVYATADLPRGEALVIADVAAPGAGVPEVQVLSVDRVEGHGQGNWLNRWNYVLIWR